MDSIFKFSEKKRIALTSVGAAIFLTGFKLLIGFHTNSLGILSEAAHSGLDLLAAILTFTAVSIADKPPDAEHTYGHGKLENISALLQTILLIITCGWIIWEAIDRLIEKTTHVDATIWAFVVMVVSILVDVSRSRALYRIAKKYHSQALEADALHFSSDIWTSLTVIVGLIFVASGYQVVDSITAIVVSFLILFVSYRLGQRTIDALMDRVPRGLGKQITEAILYIKGVEELRNLRIRTSGSKVFVDATVAILRTTPFEKAHHIMDAIEQVVHRIHPLSDVIVHAEPVVGKNETIEDKIRMIVVEKGLPTLHNLVVNQINDKYHLDFDIEYDSKNTFTKAHTLASEIETEIRRQIPNIENITIHMEDIFTSKHNINNATEQETKLCEEIKRMVLENPLILSCSNLTLLAEGNTYRVTLDCRIQSSKTLNEVHQIITELEVQLRQRFRQLRRVTIHPEPEKQYL
jgi:cation diffusion facilitator family transporter